MLQRLRKIKNTIPIASAFLIVALPLFIPLVYADCAVPGAQSYQPHYAEIEQAIQNAAANRMGAGYPTLPRLKKGYPTTAEVDPTIPPVILRAIAAVESGWKQSAYSVQRGQTGPTLISYSCGYGIMQITSGMRNTGDLNPAIQQRIASEYAYNVAYGAKMLGDKWNLPGAIWGDRNPSKNEHWYFAVWAYNYRHWRNNPHNPDYTWPRPRFDPESGWPKSEYPYQELVWGYAEHPLRGSNGAPLWESVNIQLPDRSRIGNYQAWGTNVSNPDWVSDQSFQISRQSLHFLATPGGASTFPETINLSDEFQNGYRWNASATSSGNWLVISKTSGTSLPDSLSVSIRNPPSTAGTYDGYVTIDAGNVPGSPAVIQVKLYVSWLRAGLMTVAMKGYSGGW